MGIAVEEATDGGGIGWVCRAVRDGVAVSGNYEIRLSDAEGSVDVDDGVVAEVGAGSRGDNVVGADGAGGCGGGGLGEGECVTVHGAGGGGREGGVRCAVDAGRVAGGYGEGSLVDSEGAVGVGEGVVGGGEGSGSCGDGIDACGGGSCRCGGQ